MLHSRYYLYVHTSAALEMNLATLLLVKAVIWMEHQCVITPLHRPLSLMCVTAPENVTNYLLHPAHYFSNKRVSAYTRHQRAAPLTLVWLRFCYWKPCFLFSCQNQVEPRVPTFPASSVWAGFDRLCVKKVLLWTLWLYWLSPQKADWRLRSIESISYTNTGPLSPQTNGSVNL